MDPVFSVRKPVVAGSFYPQNASDLKSQILDLLARAKESTADEKITGRIFALVAPHAGYIYSGLVAAHGYKLIENSSFRTVVVISPSHMEHFPFASVFSGEAYETPLGAIPVDQKVAEEIASNDKLVIRSDKGHIQSHLPHREHSLEVQLPFLQSVLEDFKIVPIVMGDQGWEVCAALGETLGRVIEKPDILAVASTDLSHFHSYDEAERLDKNFCRILEEMDPEMLFEAVQRHECEACGAGPVIAVTIAAKIAGAEACRVLARRNSGDVLGDGSSVVGYTSAACFGG